MRKRVGDGRTIDIWNDRWIPNKGNAKVTTAKPLDCKVRRVQEIIKEGKLNMSLMRTFLNEEDCKRISRIPISSYGGKDRMVWAYSSLGEYTVKTRCGLAKAMQ